VYAVTINLPDDLERFIRAEVHSGHFASEEDVIAEAVRLLKRQLSQVRATPAASDSAAARPSDPVLGAMRDAAEEMDEIVAEAMTHREHQPWRLSPSE
jgi:putative addiction module CopG family antidote